MTRCVYQNHLTDGGKRVFHVGLDLLQSTGDLETCIFEEAGGFPEKDAER